MKIILKVELLVNLEFRYMNPTMGSSAEFRPTFGKSQIKQAHKCSCLMWCTFIFCYIKLGCIKITSGRPIQQSSVALTLNVSKFKHIKLYVCSNALKQVILKMLKSNLLYFSLETIVLFICT